MDNERESCNVLLSPLLDSVCNSFKEAVLPPVLVGQLLNDRKGNKNTRVANVHRLTISYFKMCSHNWTKGKINLRVQPLDLLR